MPEGEEPVRIRPQDVQVSLTSPELVNALIRNREEALRFLSDEVAPVDISDVSVDVEGRVIIENPQFLRALQEQSRDVDPQALLNYICGFGC